MQKIKLILIGLMFINTSVFAQSGCITVGFQDFCAPPGGSVHNFAFQAVCGKGQCVRHGYSLQCSKVPGGSAIVSGFQAKCTGGCEEAKPRYCQKPY